MSKYDKGEFVIVPNKSQIRGLEPVLQVLFMWLCDHSNENMKSFPSRKALAEECGVSIRTLDRGIQELVDKGFIVKSARSNGKEQITNLYEVVIFDIPAKSRGGSDKSALGGVATKTTLPSDKNDTRNSTHLTQPNITTTNVVVGAEAPEVYGKPEINEAFEYWETKTGVGIQARRQQNRNAANNLLKRYGTEKLHQLIDGVALAQGDRYAPRISDFTDLQSKLTQLLTWGKTQTSKTGKVVKI